jgi:hypothetical protein
MVEELATIALGMPVELPTPKVRAIVKVPNEVFDRYVGKYEIGRDKTIRVFRDGERLMIEETDAPAVQLRPFVQILFTIEDTETEVSFVESHTGKIEGIRIHKDNSTIEGPRREQ